MDVTTVARGPTRQRCPRRRKARPGGLLLGRQRVPLSERGDSAPRHNSGGTRDPTTGASTGWWLMRCSNQMVRPSRWRKGASHKWPLGSFPARNLRAVACHSARRLLSLPKQCGRLESGPSIVCGAWPAPNAQQSGATEGRRRRRRRREEEIENATYTLRIVGSLTFRPRSLPTPTRLAECRRERV